MKVASLETLYCDAGWRPWIFLKATTDDGLVGWAEITDSHGSPRGLAGIVEDLAPLVVGRDPRPVEAIYWDLFRATRQSPGSVIAKALAGIENALLDIKAKALGIPVYELFGGPTRESIPMYWSHCGTTRARAFEVTGTPKLASYDDVVALGREVTEGGYGAFKTNVVVPGEEPKVLMPGFNEGGGTLRAEEIADALVRLLEAFAEGTGGNARPIVDLNFNLEPEGCVRVAKALEPFDLLWLEVDLFDPAALAHVRHVAPMPICSGENLYSSRDFRPYLEVGGMDVASVDVIWNGFHQAKKIADLAETFEVNCAPHNYYSHLATFISAQWCAAIPNARILEYDVDDVPWRDELVTALPEISAGELRIPSGPGWGVELNEAVLTEHPWPIGVRGLAKRAAWSAAVRMGLQVYDPSPENLPRLEELTEYADDPRPIGDERPTTATDRASGPDRSCRTRWAASSTSSAFAALVCSRWDRSTASTRAGSTGSCEPSELVFSDFESDSHLHAKWVESLERPHRFVYGDLRAANELLELEQFDLVFFLGVLYHSIHHLPLARDAQPRDEARRDDALRDLDRPAARRARAPSLAGERQGERRPHDPGRQARARVDGLAEGHALHGLPARVVRGPLPVREDGRAPRRRRPLRRRDAAPARIASSGCPTCAWRRRPSSIGSGTPTSPRTIDSRFSPTSAG